ncbi:aminoglycoside phosphotransferase family protein [Glycomyces sp. TRM65418]|uniref:aminoglycoside phosphotransferase family protein n=1 Tax=Glycomyces sp. TRM65418 TaxID=2867006 RepID=UPI001CE4DDEA|nr:aminoglycoside phosphotransferase family protein [Glycomyces sp. TRM65418]MCC3764085.1 aminoglycoside phosphotransferase family protein [Glycomyces sp. TRM65418]QZD53775.1 aminoglycoside phosphotransferase family protein [Glycomyces sp. TRM65418]
MRDLVIDEALVRSLLTDQHPDLADRDLRRMEGGWDNQMWRLGDDLAVRLPRTDRAPELLTKEHRWMPELASRLPLPVPVPVRLGEPSDRFPATWIVTGWVDGTPADLAPIDRGPHAAEALAGFLAALHRPAPADAPSNPDRGGPLTSFTDEVERSVQGVDDPRKAVGMRAVWDDALAAPEWDRPPVWLHGDLHPANVVVADGTLAGVVDFGELCAGDPATDLSAAWLLLPEGADAPFFKAYNEADEATVRRARGWALRRSLHLIAIGHAGELGRPGGKPTWKPAGEAALNRVLASHEASR